MRQGVHLGSVRKKLCCPGKHDTLKLMLDQCWPAVYDVGPKLTQHRFSMAAVDHTTLSHRNIAGSIQHHPIVTNILHMQHN